MAGKCGPNFGRSQITTASRWLIRSSRSSSNLARVLQKQQTRCALPFRIRIRKMRANIAEPAGTKQRVAKRVASTSPSEWPTEPLSKRHFDAADHQLAPRRQSVQIVTNAWISGSFLRGAPAPDKIAPDPYPPAA